jgi:hypothetical protein
MYFFFGLGSVFAWVHGLGTTMFGWLWTGVWGIAIFLLFFFFLSGSYFLFARFELQHQHECAHL